MSKNIRPPGKCRMCKKDLSGMERADVYHRESGFVELCSKTCVDAWEDFEAKSEAVEQQMCDHPTMWEDE